jgi:hypothetical protein
LEALRDQRKQTQRGKNKRYNKKISNFFFHSENPTFSSPNVLRVSNNKVFEKLVEKYDIKIENGGLDTFLGIEKTAQHLVKETLAQLLQQLTESTTIEWSINFSLDGTKIGCKSLLWRNNLHFSEKLSTCKFDDATGDCNP